MDKVTFKLWAALMFARMDSTTVKIEEKINKVGLSDEDKKTLQGHFNEVHRVLRAAKECISKGLSANG